MRTVIVILIGTLIALAWNWLSRRFDISLSPALVFGAVWGLFCVVDTWWGVVRGGYGLREELIIHAAIFAIPLVILLLVRKLGWGV